VLHVLHVACVACVACVAGTRIMGLTTTSTPSQRRVDGQGKRSRTSVLPAQVSGFHLTSSQQQAVRNVVCGIQIPGKSGRGSDMFSDEQQVGEVPNQNIGTSQQSNKQVTTQPCPTHSMFLPRTHPTRSDSNEWLPFVNAN
jgi:hypothetical protein